MSVMAYVVTDVAPITIRIPFLVQSLLPRLKQTTWLVIRSWMIGRTGTVNEH